MSGNWTSRTIPDLRPMPGAFASGAASSAEYGADIIRYRADDAGSINGIEYWATEVSFVVGRRLTGIEYLYTPGQTIHDGGRLPRKGSVKTAWFGVGWENRVRDFLFEIETGTTSNLVLPHPWGAFSARVFDASVQQDPSMAGCDIEFRYEEEGHTDWNLWEEIPSPAAVLASVPDDAEDLKEAMQGYVEALVSPLYTADDLALLLLEMRTRAAAYVAEVQATSQSLQDEEYVALAVAGAVRLFPDRVLLAAVWV